MGYFLRSPRLGFRPWTPEDLDLAIGLWGDPRVTALIDSRGQLLASQVAERLDREIAMLAEHGVQYWPIFLLAGDQHIGCCGLRPNEPATRTYELGVHIRSAYWGNGYGYEAAQAVIEHAFSTLGAARLFAGHNPKNEGSRQLIARLGFRYTHDALYPPTGLMHPSYILNAPAP